MQLASCNSCSRQRQHATRAGEHARACAPLPHTLRTHTPHTHRTRPASHAADGARAQAPCSPRGSSSPSSPSSRSRRPPRTRASPRTMRTPTVRSPAAAPPRGARSRRTRSRRAFAAPRRRHVLRAGRVQGARPRRDLPLGRAEGEGQEGALEARARRRRPRRVVYGRCSPRPEEISAGHDGARCSPRADRRAHRSRRSHSQRARPIGRRFGRPPSLRAHRPRPERSVGSAPDSALRTRRRAAP